MYMYMSHIQHTKRLPVNISTKGPIVLQETPHKAVSDVEYQLQIAKEKIDK